MITYFTNNQNQEEEFKTIKSNFHIVLQPELTVIFKTDNKLGYRLGFSINSLNLGNSSKNFIFNNKTTFSIPQNQSSNLFFVAGFIF